MFYLLIGFFVFLHFHKKFGVPIITNNTNDTLYNLGMVCFMILFWPLFIVLELLNKIRGVK